MKTFIDNVTIQVIESFIVESLVEIFTPLSVVQMEEELVRKIASESPENQTQRQLLELKVDVLAKGMEICKRYGTYRSAGETIHYRYEDYTDLSVQRSRTYIVKIIRRGGNT